LAESEGASPESKMALSEVSLESAEKKAADKVEVTILQEALKQFNGNVKEIVKCLNMPAGAIHMKLNYPPPVEYEQPRLDPQGARGL